MEARFPHSQPGEAFREFGDCFLRDRYWQTCLPFSTTHFFAACGAGRAAAPDGGGDGRLTAGGGGDRLTATGGGSGWLTTGGGAAGRLIFGCGVAGFGGGTIFGATVADGPAGRDVPPEGAWRGVGPGEIPRRLAGVGPGAAGATLGLGSAWGPGPGSG
jgi:hypothetical protein